MCKSFASDTGLEDLGLNTCWTHKADAKQANLPLYDPNNDPKFPQFLTDELELASDRCSQQRKRGAH